MLLDVQTRVVDAMLKFLTEFKYSGSPLQSFAQSIYEPHTSILPQSNFANILYTRELV